MVAAPSNSADSSGNYYDQDKQQQQQNQKKDIKLKAQKKKAKVITSEKLKLTETYTRLARQQEQKSVMRFGIFCRFHLPKIIRTK